MKDLTIGHPLKTIVAFGLPLYFGSLLQQAYILVDSIIIGQHLGGKELAALGISGPLVYFVVSIILGMAIGFSIKISQHKGAKSNVRIVGSIRSMLALFFCSGIVISLLSPWLATFFIWLMKVPTDIVGGTTIYTKTLLYGLIFQFLVIGISAALRALGDSITPLYMLFTTSVLNIVLDIVLIIYFDMGIFGAALATVITQIIGFIALIIYVIWKNPFFRDVFVIQKTDFDGLLETLKLGVFPACQHMMLSAGILVMIWILTPFGAAVIAAATIVGRIEMFVVMFFSEMGSANTTFVAQNYGKGDVLRVTTGFKQTLVLCATLAIALTALILAFPEFTVRLFTQDTNVIDIATVYIQILFLFFTFLAMTNVMHGFLNGMGKTQVAFLCTIYSFILTRVPLTYVFGHYFGIVGFWWAGSTGWLIGFLYTFWIVTKVINTFSYINDNKKLAMKGACERNA